MSLLSVSTKEKNMIKSHFTIDKLLIDISILLIGFDSLPIMQSRMYRPISVIFLIIPLTISLINFRLYKNTLWLLIFDMYAFIMSIIISNFKYNDFSGVKQSFPPLILGTLIFICFKFYFNQESIKCKNNDEYVKKFFSIFCRGYILIYIIGLIQILSILHVLPIDVLANMNSFFGGIGRTDRISLASAEPSWAGLQLLFSIPIFYYMKKVDSKYKKWFYIGLVLFIFCFSLQSIISLFFSFMLYFIIKYKKNCIKLILKIVLYTIMFVFLFEIIFFVAKSIFGTGYYFMQRIENISLIRNNFYSYLLSDGSLYVRIIFPIIGLLIFVKNPLVGIGLGNYRFEFTNIILSKFPEATNFSEVLSYINAGFTTPKSLYIKILCECGIIGFIIFSIFIFNILRKVLKAKFKLFNKNIILFFTCSLLSIMLQFDTMAYLNFWIGLAFIDSLKIKYNSI